MTTTNGTERTVSLTRYTDPNSVSWSVGPAWYSTAYDALVDGALVGRIFHRLHWNRAAAGWDAVVWMDTGPVWVGTNLGTRKAAVAAVVAAQS